MSTPWKIAAIPGDGIGTEVIGAGLDVLRALAGVEEMALKAANFDRGGAMMLDHLGETASSARLMRAIERVSADPWQHSPDLDGEAATVHVTDAAIRAIRGDRTLANAAERRTGDQK